MYKILFWAYLKFTPFLEMGKSAILDIVKCEIRLVIIHHLRKLIMGFFRLFEGFNKSHNTLIPISVGVL